MRNEIKTILCPYKLNNNVSFDIKRDYLQDNGYEVIHLGEAIKSGFKNCKIANLNFYESSYTSSRIKCFMDYIKKTAVLYLMKIKKVKIIYTMHNKIGHDTKFAKIEIKMIRKLCMMSDAIVVLCEESKSVLEELFDNNYREIKNKIEVIPLVSYESAYLSANTDIRKSLGIDEDKMLFTFIGGVRRYKNIELIINAAKAMDEFVDVHFLIAGSGDCDYINELKDITKDLTNITFMDRFVDNDEMADMAKCTSIFIFPYDIKSSLNSGSCMYAFSFKRNVICPMIGTIKDLRNQVTYAYDYDSADNHEENLINMCRVAYDEWKYNKKVFNARQDKLYEETVLYHSVKIISKKYDDLYKKLLQI